MGPLSYLHSGLLKLAQILSQIWQKHHGFDVPGLFLCRESVKIWKKGYWPLNNFSACRVWAFWAQWIQKPALTWAWPQDPKMGPPSFLHRGQLKLGRVWTLPYWLGDKASASLGLWKNVSQNKHKFHGVPALHLKMGPQSYLHSSLLKIRRVWIISY